MEFNVAGNADNSPKTKRDKVQNQNKVIK